ncbi:MAG: ribosomal protein S12 methylthiotransferase RimO [Acidobacteria bacterium RIFCSPLOWO2_12_FULL_68_19]|nr:MAG: ribosomal protein S12 methylthiotransferase RimO [Acidobacteria bacterium RIFCSPLOWO2_12_FULL_68_19]
MKIGMISLGCPKNLVDSEVMLGLARRAGHELTSDAAQADVLIVNTCAFIDGARRESIDAILEMAEFKKRGACRRLVVAGCMAERYRDELRAEIPEIDAVVGTGEVPQIVEAIDAGSAAHASRAPQQPTYVPLLRSNGEPVRPTARRLRPGADSLPTYLYDADTPRLLATPRHYAYVKIAEGCDYTCAFCIIPRLRGRYRSRPADEIVREAAHLASLGVKELLLVSQDTTFYGIDRGERGALARLLRALDRIDGLEWIRLLYLYPTTIGDEILEAIGESGKVCRYIDLPLQHASDRVLARMKRPGTRAAYERLLERIRTRLPGVTLRTTFIVGFPGETERDVADLLGFVEAVRFDHVGVFTYSHEDGTAAHALSDDVPAPVKRDRRGRLMRAQERIVTRAQQARVGSHARLLVDGPTTEHELVLRGRLEGQAPDIDSLVYLTECDPAGIAPGTFLDVELVGHRGYDLVARPLTLA